MKKVLFICHGNICRSPLAQSVFTHMVKSGGIADKFFIDSMATSTEEIGSPPHPGTVRKLYEAGIPVVPHSAKQITRADYSRFDYIICMDERNVRALWRILGADPEGKVYKLLSFAGTERDIADPWYSGNFDATFSDVYKGCEALLEYFNKNGI